MGRTVAYILLFRYNNDDDDNNNNNNNNNNNRKFRTRRKDEVAHIQKNYIGKKRDS